MKKILCFTLALLLCLSSVCNAYASSTDSDHGGTGGSLGDNHGGTGGSIDWDKLQPCDDELINKAKETLNYMIFPDKAGVAAELLSLLGSNDLDDDTKKYMDDNLKDNVKTDGTYFYYSPTYIQNINHKVQNRVHALNGFYLYDSSGAISYNAVNSVWKKFFPSYSHYFDNLSSGNYQKVINFISSGGSFLFFIQNNVFYIYSMINSKASTLYPCFNGGGHITFYDTSTNDYISSNSISYLYVNSASLANDPGTGRDSEIWRNTSNIVAVYGTPLKVFYTPQDVRNYAGQGQQHYSPNLPNKTIKIPINYTTIAPKLNLDFDISGKLADEIQGQLDLNFNAWLDKLAEINVNPSNPTPTPGSSGGGSGGDHGGTGGDFGNPTPTPDPDGGFTSGTYDLLDQIYKWLVSFGEKHDIFARKITDYIEANDGKLDQIIEAVNALADGKTETENNGCKYDFTALSDFMTKLWNDSDQKFDTMVSLLEENNRYQQKLVNSLNEIKAILVTQTVLELFQDRSSETANKAKDKFPTSLPWDIAMVVNAMAAEPQEIKIDLPIEIQSLGIHEEINIDLSSGEWEKLAKTCRYLLSILFILFMIHLSRKMFFNGGDD